LNGIIILQKAAECKSGRLKIQPRVRFLHIDEIKKTGSRQFRQGAKKKRPAEGKKQPGEALRRAALNNMRKNMCNYT
jgi:hypothetical protein